MEKRPSAQSTTRTTANHQVLVFRALTVANPTRPASLSEFAHRKRIADTHGIEHLYYLAPIDNAESILQHGILSHKKARQFNHHDISLREVNDRRRSFRVPGGRPLHDYVPLYFTPRNPMLYTRRDIQDDIVVLCVDRDLIFGAGVFFTDGNAASVFTHFFDNPESLDQLDWHCIRSHYWTDFEDGRRKRCSEVLVPDRVSSESIRRIVVHNQTTLVTAGAARDRVAAQSSSLAFPIDIDTTLYF